MRNISINESAQINAGAEKVWEIIGPNFVDISVWGPGILKSWENDSVAEKLPDAPAGGRYCDLGSQGIIDERIIHYDNDSYQITWSAAGEKLPGFLQGLQNALKIEKIDDHTCRVTSNITANARGIMGFLMGGMVEKTFAKTLPGFIEAWKMYAETGDLTETKQKEVS